MQFLIVLTIYVSVANGQACQETFFPECQKRIRAASKRIRSIQCQEENGNPVYTYCKAKDGTVFHIPGFDCVHSDCPADAKRQNVTADCNYDSIGDGVCDDVNNNARCNYDNGDCCKKEWMGDGQCDERNNFFSCHDSSDIILAPGWWYTSDGGDCRKKGLSRKCLASTNDPLSKALIAKFGSSWDTNEEYLSEFWTFFSKSTIPDENSCMDLSCTIEEFSGRSAGHNSNDHIGVWKREVICEWRDRDEFNSNSFDKKLNPNIYGKHVCRCNSYEAWEAFSCCKNGRTFDWNGVTRYCPSDICFTSGLTIDSELGPIKGNYTDPEGELRLCCLDGQNWKTGECETSCEMTRSSYSLSDKLKNPRRG